MPPTAVVFTVKGHTNLGIIIYLFQFLLCLTQVILAYRRLRNQLRQAQTIMHLNSIRIHDSRYHLSNLPLPHPNNNNDHGLYLPNQPAYSVPAFNAHDCLVRLHQEVSNFLHYQLHVRLHAASSLPPSTHPALEHEREAILEFLCEERERIRTIKGLLNAVDANDQELIWLYEYSPSHKTKTGETSHGVPYRNGNKYPRKNSHSPRSGSSAPHNNHSNHYNPRANETDYDDYDTPELGDLYSDEVYNNID
jgi:hypothetical protein